MEEAVRKADVLIEALPYIKNFRGKVFVIKYGGSILSEEKVRRSVLEDIVFLHFMGIDVVLVHGGGPNITERLKTKKIIPAFHQGVRITDQATLQVVAEELTELNRMVATELQQLGAFAVGVCGKDSLIYVEKKKSELDLGFVGTVCGLNEKKFREFLSADHLVVLSPLGVELSTGVTYNVNADEVASYLAGRLSAEKFVLLTNVRGVMRNVNDPDSLISSAREADIKHMIAEGIISDGMIPKACAGLDALDRGAKKAHIIDARIPHALLLEIFTDTGIGTEITGDG